MSTAQVNSVITVGGASQSTGSGIIIPNAAGASLVTLNGSVASSTADNYIRLGASGPGASDAAQYQVPANFDWVGSGFYVFYAFGGTIQIQFGYGTAALIAQDTATAPTGNVRYGGGTGAASGGYSLSVGAATVTWFPISVFFPEASYPYFRTQAGGQVVGVTLVGQLVAN